ncbi:hypothetical protein F511_28299 [Dorcoceras hygrometricum]|uniref:Uncharacterized protein n=1 Tax=Dorcoceras hygrometricum TaxID=472368 RepID=A0A2Z7AU56_9LAMI|nr:hypothetical protein F511_28299 [Dorcoceras hygrometricum]
MDKQSKDMRSKNTEFAYPEAKRTRTSDGREAVNQCMDLIVHPSVQISLDITDTFFKSFQHGQRVDRLEQLKSKEMFNSFKSTFNQCMVSLELSIADAHKAQLWLIIAKRRQYLQLIKDRDRDQDDLSYGLTSKRLLQLDAVHNYSSERNSSLASLSSQLAEVVAHLKIAGDVKKEEGGSSRNRKGESSSGGKSMWF